jgi:hypothetical protein
MLARNLMGVGFSAGQSTALTGYGSLAATATGTNQATGFPIVNDITEFTTVAASTAAVLPSPTGLGPGLGDTFLIVNNGANALAVFPPVGFSIGTAAANTALSLPANKAGYYTAKGNGNYWAVVSA